MADLNVSTLTIGRRLQEVGLWVRVVVQQLKITDENALERLLFEQQYVARPMAHWDVTILSDEKTFK